VEPLGVKLYIGLTGGIGSGKSTAASMLARHGAALVDTDAIARRITLADGAAMPSLIAAFGATVATPDGALDREAMRRLAFADAPARRRLEAVLHPMIGDEAVREAKAATAETVVFDVPLLAASSVWRARVQRILVIDCSEATQIERVTARPGWTRVAAAQAIASQSSRAERRAIADAVIVNDSIDRAALEAQIGTLWHLWNNLPRKHGASP
jgi:dephospho-CoA kinase